MAEKRKAPTGAATSAGAEAETAACDGAAISIGYDTTRKGLIASILCTGRENALTAREIARVLGLSDTRHITSLIESERKRGGIICATTGNPSGYYIPANLDELAEYNKRLRRRIMHTTATLDALQRAADAWSGQTKMEGFDG